MGEVANLRALLVKKLDAICSQMEEVQGDWAFYKRVVV